MFVVLSVHFVPRLRVRFARCGNGSESKTNNGRGHGAPGGAIGARSRTGSRTEDSRAGIASAVRHEQTTTPRACCPRFVSCAIASSESRSLPNTEPMDVFGQRKNENHAEGTIFWDANRFQPERTSELQRIQKIFRNVRRSASASSKELLRIFASCTLFSTPG